MEQLEVERRAGDSEDEAPDEEVAEIQVIQVPVFPSKHVGEVAECCRVSSSILFRSCQSCNIAPNEILLHEMR